jgi:hypothetical protein
LLSGNDGPYACDILQLIYLMQPKRKKKVQNTAH